MWVQRGAGDGVLVPPRRARPLAGHADAEARRSVLTALLCATLVTAGLSGVGATSGDGGAPNTAQAPGAAAEPPGSFRSLRF